MKTCSKCKIEKPFEAFSKNKNSKDGHRTYCKECERLRYLELKKNPLMQLEKQIRSSIRLENKLLKRENKKLCSCCKEIFLIEDLVCEGYCKKCFKIYQKEFIEKNKGYYKTRNDNNKDYRKEYYEKNKEKMKEYNREYHRQYRLKKKLEKLQNNNT